MLGSFNGPVDGQPHFAFRRQLPQRLGQHGIGQPVGRQPLVMQQARQAFDRCLLIAQAAGQRGLDTGLFLYNHAHKGRNPFELVAMCPGEYIRDILGQASNPRVLGCHKPRLSRVRARGYSPPNECVLTSESARRKGGKKEGGGGHRCTAVFPSVQHFSFIYPRSAEWLLTRCLPLSLCTHWYTLPPPFGTQSFAIDTRCTLAGIEVM